MINNREYTLFVTDNECFELNQFNLFKKIKEEEPLVIIQNGYLELIEQNILDIGGVEFKFTDIRWDFRNLMTETKLIDKQYIYKFDEVRKTNNYYETLCKLYILNSIFETSVHTPSINIKFRIVQKFISFIFKSNIINIDLLTLEVIEKYIYSLNQLKYTTIIKYKSAVKDFLTFYSLCTNNEIDSSIIDKLEEIDYVKYKSNAEDSKYVLLPQEFMKNLTEMLYSFVFDISQTEIDRRLCGLLYVCTQTGLRPSELLLLKKDCIKEVAAEGLKATYLEYISTKNAYGAGYIHGKTIANNKVVEVINTLKSFTDDNNLSSGIKYEQLNDFLRLICTNYYFELNNISNEIDERYDGKPLVIHINNEKKYINIPNLTQFRVYYASELSQRGYSEFAIANLLNHQDEKMFNYYARPVTSIQEDPYFSETIIKDIIVEDYEILGTNGSKYKKLIESFVEKNDINIEMNIENIVHTVAQNVPIRQKLGGCCIKANQFRSCEHDADTDEIFCAYGLCKNQCHFFYNIAYYYEKFKEAIQIVEFNMKMKYKQQSQKELYKLQNIISTKLIPELKELDREINRKGEKHIISKYPSLEKVINDRKMIEKEINIWKKRKL